MRIQYIVLLMLLIVPLVNAKHYEEPTNITDFGDLFQWNNRVTNSMFGLGVLLIVFFVSFVLLKGFESSQAFTGCVFFTFLTAVTLRLIGILDTVWVIASGLIMGLIILLIFFTKE